MKGTLTKEGLIDRLSLSYDHKSIEWLIASTLSKERGFIDETVAIAKKLSLKGYRLYLLSNFSYDAYKTFIEGESFFNPFNGILCSFQAGSMKPEHTLYKLLLNKYNLQADESIFIDDSAENVRAAQELHINGIVYKKGELARALIQQGIIID